jgi:hypothetical protein
MFNDKRRLRIMNCKIRAVEQKPFLVRSKFFFCGSALSWVTGALR